MWTSDHSSLFHKTEVNFKFLWSTILERNSQLLTALSLLDCQRNYLFVEVREMELFLAYELWNLNPTCQKNFHFLLLCDFLPIPQEFLHTVIVAIFQEVFEAVLHAKLFISIGQDTNVDHWEHIFMFFSIWASDYNDKILFSFRSQLESNSFSEFFGDGIFNVPWLMLNLAIYNVICLFSFKIKPIENERQFRLSKFFIKLFLAELKAAWIYGELHNLFWVGKISDVEGWS